jgi:hypothetical protein
MQESRTEKKALVRMAEQVPHGKEYFKSAKKGADMKPV